MSNVITTNGWTFPVDNNTKETVWTFGQTDSDSYNDFRNLIGVVNIGFEDGNDEVIGGQNNDILKGNRGDDRLDGYWGDDTLKGGEGNDTFVLSIGNDVITDFTIGEDKIEIDVGRKLQKKINKLLRKDKEGKAEKLLEKKLDIRETDEGLMIADTLLENVNEFSIEMLEIV